MEKPKSAKRCANGVTKSITSFCCAPDVLNTTGIAMQTQMTSAFLAATNDSRKKHQTRSMVIKGSITAVGLERSAQAKSAVASMKNFEVISSFADMKACDFRLRNNTQSANKLKKQLYTPR